MADEGRLPRLNAGDRLVLVLAVGVAVGLLGVHWALSRGVGGVRPEVREGEKVRSHLVDLNRSELWELEALNGIGRVHAEQIVEYRRRHNGFKSVDELENVKGIGPTMMRGLREHVTVGDAGVRETRALDDERR